MATITFDTLKLVKNLKLAGFAPRTSGCLQRT